MNLRFNHFPIHVQMHKGANLALALRSRSTQNHNLFILGPGTPMLYTKFQGHRPSSFREDFEGVFAYMGVAAILVMWPRPFVQTFVPKTLRRHMKFGFNRPNVLRGEDVWKCGRRRASDDDGPQSCYKLTLWAFGSGEQTTQLNIKFKSRMSYNA